MRDVLIRAADCDDVDVSLKNTELDSKEIRELKAYFSQYYPQYINHSESRWDGSIPLTFTDPKGVLRWNGCVGVLHLQYPQQKPKYDLTIHFRSRFDEEEKHYFLAALLHSWLESSADSLRIDRISASGAWDEIFDFMSVAVFRKQLMEAVQTGVYRAYQYFGDHSDRLRGCIDVPRHIRLNLGMQNGKIAMRYRENTPDNAVNHLILHTYARLKQRFPEQVSLLIEADASGAALRDLRYLAPSWEKTDPAAVAAKLQKPIPNPLYDAYERLRDTCLRILSEQGVLGLRRGTGREDSLLFYAPDLWENYLYGQILSKVKNVATDGQYALRAMNGHLNLRPDFVLSAGGRRLVLDAKYKELWETFPKENRLPKASIYADDIKQCLIYQMLLPASGSGILYPATNWERNTDRRIHICENDPQKAGSFHTFGVRLPKCGEFSYQQWREALAAEEARTAGNIAEFCRELGVYDRQGQ